MKILATILFALLLAASATGCGNNPCEAACDKMKECKLEGSSSFNCSGDCPSEFEPMMNCVADLSCEEMKDQKKMMECAAKK